MTEHDKLIDALEAEWERYADWIPKRTSGLVSAPFDFSRIHAAKQNLVAYCEMQAEALEMFREEQARHKETVTALTEENERLRRMIELRDVVIDTGRQERVVLAKLAADYPTFDNPLVAFAAEALRDKVLEEAGIRRSLGTPE